MKDYKLNYQQQHEICVIIFKVLSCRLQDNLSVSDGSTVFTDDIYTKYEKFASLNALKTNTKVGLGKMLKTVFPKVYKQPRYSKLKKRNCSAYIGLKITDQIQKENKVLFPEIILQAQNKGYTRFFRYLTEGYMT